MARRTVCILAIAAVTGACARQPQIDVRQPAPQPTTLETQALVFPTIDSTTLASLSALLERTAQDSSLLSALTLSDSRMYSLFRELEAAQERFVTMLSTPDATGRTLYDRLAAMTVRADSLFRELEARNRQAPRP